MCRLIYSAPRLLRDQIRAEDGSYVQDWTQPMMRALFGPFEGKANPQELKDAAVQLMPDNDIRGQRRILLNFPLSLDDQRIKARIGKASLWEKQFTWKKGDVHAFVKWPEEFDGKEPHRWWEKLSTFSVLSADLGTRHAASVAVIECGKTGGGTSRFIGCAGDCDWFARYRSGAILRLPGENAMVLRPAGKLDKDGSRKVFREEFHGERGRSADPAEIDETLTILDSLRQAELLAEWRKEDLGRRFSFPELNDKLLVGVRRAQNWIATCISWHWKLTNPENEAQREKALSDLVEQDRVPEWQPLAKGGGYASTVEKLRTQMVVTDDENRHMALVSIREFLRSPMSRATAREEMTRMATVEKAVTGLVTTQSKNHENLAYKLLKTYAAYRNVILAVHQEPDNLADYGKELPENIQVYKGAIESLKLSLGRPQKTPGMFEFLTKHLPGQSKLAVGKRFQSDMRQYPRCTLAANDSDNGILGRGLLMECEFQFYPDGTISWNLYTTIGDSSPIHTVGCGTYSIEGRTLTIPRDGNRKSYTMEIEADNDLMFQGQRLILKHP
jgi:hypothetical protein